MTKGEDGKVGRWARQGASLRARRRKRLNERREALPRFAAGRFGRIGSCPLQPTGRFRRRSLYLWQSVLPDFLIPLLAHVGGVGAEVEFLVDVVELPAG